MLRRVEIQGFKCLHDVSADLGPFNVLIGPNDSGKSSFLQALAWARHRVAPSKAREALVRYETERVDFALRWSRHQLKLSLNGTVDTQDTILDRLVKDFPGDARYILLVAGPVMLEPTEIASPSPRGSGVLEALIQSRGRGATAHLARAALGDRTRYEIIQQGMRDITAGRVQEVVVGEDTGQGYPLSFRMHDGQVLPASEMSQGLLIYFAFLTIVHRDDAPSLLLIEEPETGVHPLRLQEIVTLLRTLCDRDVQIVLTTHSPDLLNACKPEEVLVFRRPKPESGTEIHRLPKDFERRAMRSTMGEIWASSGEEGLLDMLPPIDPQIQAEAE